VSGFTARYDVQVYVPVNQHHLRSAEWRNHRFVRTREREIFTSQLISAYCKQTGVVKPTTVGCSVCSSEACSPRRYWLMLLQWSRYRIGGHRRLG